MTTESSENGVMTLFRMNFSGHVEHVIIFSWIRTTARCLEVRLGLRLGLGLGLDLVFGWLVVLLSVVIVTLPITTSPQSDTRVARTHFSVTTLISLSWC